MIQIVTESFPTEPGLDTGISRALVDAVGSGDLPETVRLHRTGPVVAFGRQDRVTAGYADAVAAAAAAGYLPVERLAGGRAAVFHEDTLAFAWSMPAANPREQITERFTMVSGLLASALGDLGLDARVGEVAGEYCPGAYSVNLGGVRKVVGIGQRLVRSAAHVGGVIVVDGGRRIADVLIPVYRALGLTWDPRTSGDLRDRSPGLDMDDVVGAVLTRVASVDAVHRAEIPAAVIEEGRRLAAQHVAPAA